VPFPEQSCGTWREEWLGGVEVAVTKNPKPPGAREPWGWNLAEEEDLSNVQWAERGRGLSDEAYFEEAAMAETDGDMTSTVRAGPIEGLLGASVPAGVAEALALDRAASALAHECQWVLVHSWVKDWAKSKAVGFDAVWVCECGEAKVVEYEV
jgi:hypothetical protein